MVPDPVKLKSWSRALRSGYYVQCKGDFARRVERKKLFRKEKWEYCAIGVAGDIFDLLLPGNSDWYKTLNPSALTSVTGLTVNQYRKILWLNDTERASFDEIARVIDTYADTSAATIENQVAQGEVYIS